MIDYKKLHNRIIDISHAKGLSHISSCVTTLPILYEIYQNKSKDSLVILSNGHAGLSQYVCVEHFEGADAEILFDRFGVHPERNLDHNIFATTGSLGLGLPIAMGAALANPDRDVNCIISDGECCEGSIWECLYFLSKHPISNLYVYVNANGYSAYDKIDTLRLSNIIESFSIHNIYVFDTSCVLKEFDLLYKKGIEAHYIKINSLEEANQLKYII